MNKDFFKDMDLSSAIIYNTEDLTASDFELSNSMKRAVFDSMCKLILNIVNRTYGLRNHSGLPEYTHFTMSNDEHVNQVVSNYLAKVHNILSKLNRKDNVDSELSAFEIEVNRVRKTLTEEQIEDLVTSLALSGNDNDIHTGFLGHVISPIFLCNTDTFNTLDLVIILLLSSNSSKTCSHFLGNKTSVLRYVYSKRYPVMYKALQRLSMESLDNVDTLVNKAFYQGMNDEYARHLCKELNACCLDCYKWDAEDFPRSKSTIYWFTRTLSYLTPKDILKSRKFYLREKGVLIHLENPYEGGIINILVREQHENDHHFINVIYTDNGYLRNFSLNMEDWYSSTQLFLIEKDFTVTFLLLNWLGVYDVFYDCVDSISQDDNRLQEVIQANDLTSSLSAFKSAVASARDLLDCFKCDCSKEYKFHYYEPTSWNVNKRDEFFRMLDSLKRDSKPEDICGCSSEGMDTDTDANADAEKSQVYFDKEISVGCYTRRLPSGCKASVSAIRKAEEHYMELKDGYTFVDEFTKTVKVINPTKSNKDSSLFSHFNCF